MAETIWSSGFTFSYLQKNEGCEIKVFGSRNHIIEFAQQLSWLAASFRIPQSEKLTLSESVLQWERDSHFQLLLLDLQQIAANEFSCWYPLFENGVVAREFPIPSRQGEIGLELPFGVMATLARVTYPMELYDGIILKGPSTALLPIKCSFALTASVQLHFIASDAHDLQLPMNSVANHVSTWYETTDFDLLSKARTFLGYCKNAGIHLGTKDPNFRDIKRSDAMIERDRPEVSRELSASLGSDGMGIFGAMFGFKVIYPRALRGTTKSINLSLEDRLLRSKEQPLLLYDTGKKRGWLVSELSVVLHIAHAWAACQDTSRKIPTNSVPFAKVLADGGLAAWDAIREGKTLELSDDGIEGRPELFIDRIKNIVTALESRKELTIERENASGSRLRNRPGLRGWEFVDLVTMSYLFKRREVPINTRTGGDWYHIANDNPDVVVLFCNGLGHPIKACEDENGCPSWTRIPEGNDYLTASVPCLKHLAEIHGGSSPYWKLTPNFYWHRPPGEILFEDCDYDRESGCNRLQDIKTKNSNAPGAIPLNASVIFGKPESIRKPRCKPLKKPVQGEEDEVAIQKHAISRPPKQDPLGRDFICDYNVNSSLSRRYYNDPTPSTENVAENTRTQPNGFSGIPLHSKNPTPALAKNTSASQRPQHNGEDFNVQDIGYRLHAPEFPSENILRKRPRIQDLRNDPQSV